MASDLADDLAVDALFYAFREHFGPGDLDWVLCDEPTSEAWHHAESGMEAAVRAVRASLDSSLTAELKAALARAERAEAVVEAARHYLQTGDDFPAFRALKNAVAVYDGPDAAGGGA